MLGHMGANGRLLLQLDNFGMLPQRLHVRAPALPFSGVRADVWSSELPQLLLLLHIQRILQLQPRQLHQLRGRLGANGRPEAVDNLSPFG